MPTTFESVLIITIKPQMFRHFQDQIDIKSIDQNIEELDLCGTYINPFDVAQHLSKRVHSLDISCNNFSSSEFRLILQNHHQLKKINISAHAIVLDEKIIKDENIFPIELFHLEELIACNHRMRMQPIYLSLPSLVVLDIQSNDLRNEEIIKLTSAFQNGFLLTLKSLNISDNHIGATGARALASCHGFLNTLIMCNNPIGDDGIFAFANVFGDPQHCSSYLTEFIIRGAYITHRGGSAMADALINNTSDLAILDMGANLMGNLGVEDMLSTLSFNTKITHLALDHNHTTKYRSCSIVTQQLKRLQIDTILGYVPGMRLCSQEGQVSIYERI